MLRRYFTAFLFAFMLVITQQSFVTHEISHIDNSFSQSQKHDKSHADFCQKCASYNGLGSSLIPDYHQFLILTAHQAFHAQLKHLSNTRFNFNYLAQAPPSLS